MNKLTLQLLASLTGVSLVGTAVGVEAAQNSDKKYFGFRASNDLSIVLDSTNSPTLSNGSGTIVDQKGVTWEYFNASDYANGHITLNSQSYVGVSSSSAYGITAINGITVDFSGDELWLLKSIDGIDWHEDRILTSEQEVLTANNWRYVRFYSYASQININSIAITYDCSGISASEDVDGARVENVLTTSGVTYQAETTDVSPLGESTGAVRFTKDGSSSTTWLIIGFGKTYKIGDVQNAAIEFDLNVSSNYGKTIQLYNGTDSSLGSSIDSSKTDAYKFTNIEGNWYHVEVPITTLISTISGYDVGTEIKDKPHTDVLNKEFNAIRINAGNAIIDNLRISSKQCELGTFNNPTYEPKAGEYFWLKVAWVGKLYPEQVRIAISDDTLARRVPLSDPNVVNGSPFYLELLAAGTVTFTCTVVSGYNRTSHTISRTFTIK